MPRTHGARLVMIPRLPDRDVLRASLDTLMYRIVDEIQVLLYRDVDSTRTADDASLIALVTVGDVLLDVVKRDTRLTDAQMRHLYHRLQRRPLERRRTSEAA
jgi:hypothetical protein